MSILFGFEQHSHDSAERDSQLTGGPAASLVVDQKQVAGRESQGNGLLLPHAEPARQSVDLRRRLWGRDDPQKPGQGVVDAMRLRPDLTKQLAMHCRWDEH